MWSFCFYPLEDVPDNGFRIVPYPLGLSARDIFCTLVNDVRANQRKNKSSEVVLICKSFTAVWTR